jgi:hypothetical protein
LYFKINSGNPICRQIKWDNNDEFFKAWKEAKTGFPFIGLLINLSKYLLKIFD